MNASVTYAGAAVAGMLSFASPCVLPLVPAYLSFLGGVSFESLASETRDASTGRRVMLAAVAFVLGFTTVFVALGASATLVGRVLSDHIDVLAKVAGAIIIVFGLHYMGVLRIPFLARDVRFHPTTLPRGIVGAYVMGLAFAFGWTPCVGPVLATILTLAGNSRSVAHGALLLGVYAAGLGVPFLIAAAAVGPFMRVVARLRSRMRSLEVALGGMMIVTGVLIWVGSIADVSGWLLRSFPVLARGG